MLRCREVAELASDYISGELRRTRRLAVNLHLAICRFCRRYVRQMRDTVRLLRRVGGRMEATSHEDLARSLFRSTRRR